MTERLEAEVHNPQLLNFQDEFRLSSFAFVVQCSNIAAASLLDQNPGSTQRGYTELQPLEDITKGKEIDRETPGIDISPTAWLFPKWRPQKVLYVFGTLPLCDIVLPHEKQISRRHFVVYLSQNGVWMVRNLSRYGTWINGDLLGIPSPGELHTQTTLNPDLSNDVRVGNFECSIHPITHTPLATHKDGSSAKLLSPNNTDFELEVSLLLEELDLRTEGTRTTSATEASVIYRPSYVTTETYHYLSNRDVPVQGDSEVSMAIHKATGQYCIAKTYGSGDQHKSYNQYEMLVLLQNCRNIVPYSEFLTAEDDTTRIITPYLDVSPLCATLGPQGQIEDLELSFVVYKHISSALACLEENGILHNDVNENTILLEYQNGRYTAHLTGFSEYTVAGTNSRKGLRQDVADLAMTIKKMLPIFESRPSCDPQFRSLLSQAIEGQISASETCAGLEAMMPGYEQAPFQISAVSKTMTIRRLVDENGTEAVRLLDFLRIVLHHIPKHLKSTELAVQKVIRKEDLIQLDGEIYCSLHDADKLLHHLHRNGHTSLLGLTPPRQPEACWYETQHIVDLLISYHEPTGMVNVTQLLNIFNTKDIQCLLESLKPTIREIRGSPQWEGYYIDRLSMAKVLQLLSVRAHQYPWNFKNHTLPPGASFGEDSEDMIAVVTDEMIGHILVNQDGVKWHGKIMTLGTAMKECADHGLFVAHDTLHRVTSEFPQSNWTSFYSDDDIMRLFDHADESDYPTAATSHASFQSQETLCFTPRKNKTGPSNVPILPWQRMVPPREEITPVEKVKEWIRVGPDILPTSFKRRKSSSSGGS